MFEEKTDQVALSVVFLRPYATMPSLQIMIGSRNWLKDSVIVNANFPQYNDDDNKDNHASNLMRCSCAEFDETKTWAHMDTMRSTQGIILKIRSVLHRCSHRIIDDGNQDKWLLIRIPVCEGDMCGAWFIYKLAFIGIVNTESSAITLDCRAKRMKLGLKSRLHYRTCAGRFISVGMCNHVEVVKSMIVSDTNGASADEIDAVNMLQLVLL